MLSETVAEREKRGREKVSNSVNFLLEQYFKLKCQGFLQSFFYTFSSVEKYFKKYIKK